MNIVMKKVQFEFEELPFPTLERFGLTREMIEDLPMHVLDDICNGRHSPVLPVRITDEKVSESRAGAASPLYAWTTVRRMWSSIRH